MTQEYALYKPIIDLHVNKYKGSDVPESVLRSKAKLILADTLENYDPSKGEFTSILNQNLMGLNRFVGDSMQIRMPEKKRQQINKVKNAIYNEYGDDEADVDYAHIGKIIGMSPKSIKAIYTQSKRSIVTDPSIESYVEHGANQYGNINDEVDKIYPMLPTQTHKDVFDYSMGTHGKQELKTNTDIANRIGISESYVRKIKDQILKNWNNNGN